MNKLIVYGTLASAAVAAVVLTPMAAGAIAGHYQGGQDNSQAIRARDGSGVGAQAALHTEPQDRQYVHLEDGTCDGTGVGDGTGAGAGAGTQQRMHGRQ